MKKEHSIRREKADDEESHTKAYSNNITLSDQAVPQPCLHVKLWMLQPKERDSFEG